MDKLVPILLLAACTAGNTESSSETGDGVTATISENGAIVARLDWSRQSHDATIALEGTTIRHSNIHAESLSPESASELLRHVNATVPRAAPNPNPNAYLTCTWSESCDEWEMFGVSCVGCAVLTEDCNVEVDFTCGK